jgi:hypothetical protein
MDVTMITDYPNLALQHLQNQFLDFDSFFSEVHEKLNQSKHRSHAILLIRYNFIAIRATPLGNWHCFSYPTH